MKSYEALADYYDKLILDERSLNGWVRFTTKYIDKKDILELACGSGAITEKLLKKGYQIVASDLSNEMLEKAKEKLDGQVELLNLDMRDFKLSKTFDGVICYNDSINYLTSLEELKMCFKCVNVSLNPNGKFLFDIHHINRMTEFLDEFIEEGKIDDTPYQWEIVSEDGYLYHHLVFFTKDGIKEEEHTQKFFTKEEIRECLDECGFDCLIYTDFTKDENEIGEKYYIVATKR